MATLTFSPIDSWYNDDTRLQQFLNVSRRNFVTYGVAQTLPNVSPLTYVLMKRSSELPYGGAWAVSPNISTDYPAVQYVYGNTDTFTINDQTPNVVNAKYEPALTVQTVRLSYKDLASYNNPNNIVDLLAKKVENAVRSIFVELCTRTTTDDGSPTTQFMPYGIRDIIDNGVFCTDLGQIDRTTNLWWNSPVYDYMALTPDNPPIFRGIQRAIVKYMSQEGNKWGKPTVAFTSYDAFQKIAESFQSIERYNVGDINNIANGRAYEVVGINVQGVDIFPDPYIQPYTITVGNSTITVSDIFFINLNYLHLDFADPFTFLMDKWQSEISNSRLSYLSVILTGWNLWTEQPKAHFKLVKVPS